MSAGKRSLYGWAAVVILGVACAGSPTEPVPPQPKKEPCVAETVTKVDPLRALGYLIGGYKCKWDGTYLPYSENRYYTCGKTC